MYYHAAEPPQLLTTLLATFTPADAERILGAFRLAAAAHGDQRRDEGTPFIDHPVAVASILVNELGSRDVETVMAALCHDVLEDCPEITPELLSGWIGERGLHLVKHATKQKVPDADKQRRDRDYLDSLRTASHDVRLLKLADRIHNLRSIPLAGDPAKARRYLDVSREEFLPLATATDITAARLVAEACDAIEAYLLAHEAG